MSNYLPSNLTVSVTGPDQSSAETPVQMNEVALLRNQIEALLAMVENRNGELEKLRKKVSDLTATNASLHTHCAILEKKLEDTGSWNEALTSMLSGRDQSHQLLEKQCMYLEGELRVKERDFNSLKANSETTNKCLEEMVGNLEEQNAKIQVLEVKNAYFEDLVAALRLQCDEYALQQHSSGPNPPPTLTAFRPLKREEPRVARHEVKAVRFPPDNVYQNYFPNHGCYERPRPPKVPSASSSRTDVPLAGGSRKVDESTVSQGPFKHPINARGDRVKW